MKIEIIPNNRKRPISTKRIVVAYMYHLQGLSDVEIAKLINRHRCTVIYLVKQAKLLIEVKDPIILEEIENYKNQYPDEMVQEVASGLIEDVDNQI